MSNVIDVKNLKKSYDNFTLDHVSFQLKRGYMMGFIGPNGAGKTTTINSILNIINPDGGIINFFDDEKRNSIQDFKERIGIVVGETAYYEFLSAKDMAKIISKFYRHWEWKTFNNYMKAFNLDPKQKLCTYSRGMKVKYKLACALSHHAEIFILDEPTSGLDPVFRHELCNIFQEIIADGDKSILFSTHITSDLENIADYITFINNGKIVFSKEKDLIMENYGLIKGYKDQKHLLKNNINLKIIDSTMGFSALTDNIKSFQKNNKGFIIEQASIEDIMLHEVKGVCI